MSGGGITANQRPPGAQSQLAPDAPAPSDRETLLALATRCNLATGPDRVLDAEIAIAIKAVPAGAFRPCAARDPGTFGTAAYDFWAAPRYTTSLDAALTLVPEGFQFSISFPVDGGAFATWSKAEAIDALDQLCATTGPLALTAAALRARAAECAS